MVSKNEHFVSIEIPVPKIYSLRLDFGSYPEKVKIKNLKLEGEGVLLFNNTEDFNLNQIDEFNLDNDSLIVSSNQVDPYMVYKMAIPFDGAKHVHNNWINLLKYVVILFVFVYFIAFRLLKLYLNEPSLLVSFSNVALFLAFLVIVASPLCKIDDSDISQAENRTLAKFPNIVNNGELNFNFGNEFNTWFNDRFFARKLLTDIYKYSLYFFNFYYQNNSAMQGDDNWLYLKWNDSENIYMNRVLFSQNELDLIKSNMINFDKEAKKIGVKQVYFYFSNAKSSIYPEFYPKYYVQKNNERRLDQLLNYVGDSVKVLNIKNELLNLKNDYKLYCKSDTHHNAHGSYWEYYYLMNFIKKDFPNLKVLSLTDDFEKKEVRGCSEIGSVSYGDLTGILNITDLYTPENDLLLNIKNPSAKINFKWGEKNNLLVLRIQIKN